VTAVAAASAAHAQTARRDAEEDTNHLVTLNREVFRYSSDGRRDPFVSLSTSSELRPTITDLRLTTVAFDPTGRKSVAILRDLDTKEQYRVKVGTQLGRMRVVRIDQKTVTFAIEEFGFSRQATLAMGDSTSSLRTP
jgi:Tfp pilus assembly protein PilP